MKAYKVRNRSLNIVDHAKAAVGELASFALCDPHVETMKDSPGTAPFISREYAEA